MAYMDEKSFSHSWKIVRVDGDTRVDKEDEVASEYPLTLRLDGEEFATIVCTPADLEDMVVGFLASEGVILTPDDIVGLTINEDLGLADVKLKMKHIVSADFYGKRFIGSCCGKGRQFYLQNDVKTARTSTSKLQVSAQRCAELMDDLEAASEAFRLTGGVHNAALCDARNGIIVARSDIGRHNALDKIFGYCLLNKVPRRDAIIAFSGRLSSEVVLKTAKIGVGIILSNAAPTDLALKLADELGITAVGFIRGNQMNLYAHTYRIT